MSFGSFLKMFTPKDRVFYGLFEQVSTNLTEMASIFHTAVNEADFSKREVLLKSLEE